MSSKLENKLLQYEKSTPISNDSELIKAIECIINTEEALPFEERDFDLIDEAVDVILSLKKVDIEQLENCAEKITDKHFDEIESANIDKVKKSNHKSVRLRWLIPIAAIVSLLIVSTTVAYALGYDLISMTKEAYVQLVEKVFYKQGEKDLIITEDVKEYESFEDLLKNEANSKLLVPTNLSGQYSIDRIYEEDYGDYKKITLHIDIDGSTQKIKIKTQYSGTFNEQSEKFQKVGAFDILYTQYDGVHQAEFLYEGDYYAIVSSSYEILTKIIESLE